jgi:hypothetical protein
MQSPVLSKLGVSVAVQQVNTAEVSEPDKHNSDTADGQLSANSAAARNNHSD